MTFSPDTDCILRACCWAQVGNCRLLGECGAAYALNRAAEPGGYLVHSHDNRTIAALAKAGLVTTEAVQRGTRMIVKARAGARLCA